MAEHWPAILLATAGCLLIGLGGANWLVDYDNRGVGYPGRTWPRVAVVLGLVLVGFLLL